mmetsp:Transcript_7041/g.26393  ORF Transcript_7041/g.26393 Transcript_7041/m.26393 type:complete len:148 (-) Transcript_7041:555-998(-)
MRIHHFCANTSQLIHPSSPMPKEFLINSSLSHPTYPIHWFPADPKKGGNFFSKNGPLQKYDEAFGALSKDYELKHNVKDSDWQGHCGTCKNVKMNQMMMCLKVQTDRLCAFFLRHTVTWPFSSNIFASQTKDPWSCAFSKNPNTMLR